MPNALQRETSPYLLQHADNPVDWHAWDQPALELARDSGKPILLSIGYSACHWCHVMAHESFEDAATAELMNERFVNIKVDREERPDLDRIYQLSQQLFTGRPGGWPLTIFLTPEAQVPFFAGTYFPKTAAYGMPSFREVLQRVADYFANHRDEIDANGERLLDALTQTTAVPDARGPGPDERSRRAARSRLGESFDAEHGGFGAAPKFPHTAEIGFLLTLAGSDDGARRIVDTSLVAMAAGGLFDHLGGGFFRYCVDGDWRIPHFEKMLYDNAALLGLYSEAWAVTGEPLYRSVAHATADWLLRDMQDPDGGFYATLDADSEGEEGKYYTFTRADIEAALAADEVIAARAYFGVDEPANFESRSWHLQPRARVLPFGAAGATIESARRKLLAVRESRPAPGRDEKILTAWNGLLVGSLARAARRLGRDDLGHAAARTVDFVRARLWQDGRLKASYKDRRARFAGYLDDYAFLAAGLVELLQWRFRAVDLRFAIELADCMLAHFTDPDGGFFFTAGDHERLIHRSKPLADEALPSGNGMAALALDSLGHLLGETRYLEAAAGTVRAALPGIARFPEAHSTLLAAIERCLEPPELLVVRADEPAIADWRERIEEDYAPGRMSLFIADDVGELPGLLATRKADATPVAYYCRGTECRAPVRDLDELRALMADAASPARPA